MGSVQVVTWLAPTVGVSVGCQLGCDDPKPLRLGGAVNGEGEEVLLKLGAKLGVGPRLGPKLGPELKDGANEGVDEKLGAKLGEPSVGPKLGEPKLGAKLGESP